MRSGLLFTLLKKKPNILVRQKQLFKYTFLESQHLNQHLKSDPNNSTNQSISQLLKTPFHFQHLEQSSFLKEKIDQHQDIRQRIYNSLRKEKNKIIQNVNQLAHRNIIDTQIWMKVFAEATELRFVELQSYPGVQSLFVHMENYLSKFNPTMYKFYLDEMEMLGLFTLRQKCVEALKKREQMSELKIENKIISLFGTASEKIPIGLNYIKDYYSQKIFNNFPEIIEKQKDIITITELQTALDKFHMIKKKIRRKFTEIIMMNFDEQINVEPEHYLTMAKNWATLGKMRECFKDLFPKVFSALVNEQPVLMLQILVTCDLQQPEKVNHVLKILNSQDYDQLIDKPKIHLLFHTLSNRGYQFGKYQNLVKRICNDTCDKLRHDIGSLVLSPVGSQCMEIDKNKKASIYPSDLSEKWIASHLRNQVKTYDERPLYFTKICQYMIMFGVIKNHKIYVVDFVDLHLALNKPKQARSMIKLKEEMFQHYGIEILKIRKSNKYLKTEINKSNKKALIDAVEGVLSTI